MKKRSIGLLTVVVASLLLVGALAGSEDEAVKKETEKLQGDWRAVKAQGGFDDTWLSFKDGKISFLKDRDRKVAESMEMKIDPSKDPKEIEIPEKGKGSMLAIYEIEADTLVLCVYRDPKKRLKERPKKITSSDDEVILMSFVRDKT